MSTPTELLKPVHVTIDVPGRGPKEINLVWSGRAAITAERCGFDVVAFVRDQKLITNCFAALWAMAEAQITEDGPMTFDEFLDGAGGFSVDQYLEPIKEAMMAARQSGKRPTQARKAAGKPNEKAKTSTDG